LLLGDLQSFRIMNRDLDTWYRDPGATLPAIDVSFRDHVEAQRRLRASAEHQRAERYWRDRLPTLPPAPGLPLLPTAAAALARARFERRAAVLPRPVWDALKERARKAGLTATSLVAAAYAEVLTAFSHTPHFSLNILYQNR